MNNIKEFIDKLKEIKDRIDNVENIDEFNSITESFDEVIDDLKPSVDFSLNVKIKKLHENAKIPKYAKDGDAGLDLVATSILYEDDNVIEYGLGVAIEIPYGYVGLIFPRSSITKKDLMLKNCVGVIDSGYRGEIKSTYLKVQGKNNNYDLNERICQLIIMPYPKINFIEVDELSVTDRGEGGYGSTGK